MLRIRAFSLIEVLVVITIVTVLLSVLIPSLSQARAQARTVICTSNLRQLFIQLNYYMNDFQGGIPPITTDWAPTGVEAGKQGWANRMTRANHLPSLPLDNDNRPRSIPGNIRFCPELVSVNPAKFDGTNNDLMHYAPSLQVFGMASSGNWVYAPHRENDLLKASETTAFFDTQWLMNYTSPPGTVWSRGVEIGHWAAAAPAAYAQRWKPGINSPEMNQNTEPATKIYRHQTNAVNFVFFDGHAVTRKYNVEAFKGFGVLVGPMRNRLATPPQADYLGDR